MNKLVRFYSSSSSASAGGELFPSVRRLLTEYGISVSSIQGTGPKKNILKGDVLDYIKQKNLQQVPVPKVQPLVISSSSSSSSPSNTATATTTTTKNTIASVSNRLSSKQTYQDEPHNNIRKVIATKLTQSKQTVPHMYMTVEVDLDQVVRYRKLLQQSDIKISVNDFVLRACALALRDNPLANSRWDEKKGETVLNKDVDISFAVSTDRGLITPIIKKADEKQLLTISQESKQLALLARDGKLKPEQFIGGTFSVSNLGMFGISSFNAIINYPQAGILAIGTGRKVIKFRQQPPQQQQQTINASASNKGPLTLDQLEQLSDSLSSTTKSSSSSSLSNTPTPYTAEVVDITLSGDNRVFDDEIASKFLESFKTYLSNPDSMML
ncbi:hypothetical protein CYY_008479 [Polysphondylium violaceum]|uniref:Peripheral subunit-binding (PSBD) domain-containing protein n=1 Tax=Polysphondylium violaceum TaxID=133409 RepID=A0A8J4PMX9_9MYCE|nr:hypothetical protein CYY_008479 [Polysphondylium violaceum]